MDPLAVFAPAMIRPRYGAKAPPKVVVLEVLRLAQTINALAQNKGSALLAYK